MNEIAFLMFSHSLWTLLYDVYELSFFAFGSRVGECSNVHYYYYDSIFRACERHFAKDTQHTPEKNPFLIRLKWFHLFKLEFQLHTNSYQYFTHYEYHSMRYSCSFFWWIDSIIPIMSCVNSLFQCWQKCFWHNYNILTHEKYSFSRTVFFFFFSVSAQWQKLIHYAQKHTNVHL